MKFLILFLFLISSIAAHATLTQRVLNCSQAGTDVLLVNGISWGEDVVADILYQNFKPNIPNDYINKKNTVGNFVVFKFSYNHSNGFVRDILESGAQKLSQNFNISTKSAFVAAYLFTSKAAVSAEFLEQVFTAKGVTFSQLSNYLITYFHPNLIYKMIQDSFNANIADTMGLKKSISSTLLNGRKLILITESQGNFFGKQAIQDLLNGEALNIEAHFSKNPLYVDN